jgi:hypothetical protein
MNSFDTDLIFVVLTLLGFFLFGLAIGLLISRQRRSRAIRANGGGTAKRGGGPMEPCIPEPKPNFSPNFPPHPEPIPDPSLPDEPGGDTFTRS